MGGEAQRRTVIDVNRSVYFPEPVGGTGWSYYRVGPTGRGRLGWNAVRGTKGEREQWRQAGNLFYRSVHEAEQEYETVTRYGMGRYLPGAKRRKERAAELFRAELAAAEERYAPVREEIGSRLAVAKEEERREEEERQRRQAAERAEWSARQQLIDRRRARCAELASKKIWGWVVGVGDTTIWVFRHDVTPTEPSPPPMRWSSKPLSAYQLERALFVLKEDEGLTAVRWDRAARERVTSECSTEDDPLQFEQWWTEVTEEIWPTPQEIPPWSPSSSRSNSWHGNPSTYYGGTGDGSGGGGHFGGHGFTIGGF